MTEWKLKSCPRCNGDIYYEREDGDCYARCLQCGYVKLVNGASGLNESIVKTIKDSSVLAGR